MMALSDEEVKARLAALASSVMARSERNGWSCGTRCSGLT
jgi:hypothetical protein